MFVGPIFHRELVTTPRRTRHYIFRAVYVTALLMLMCTAWLVVAGTQIIRSVGDMARFGSVLFQILAPLQLALMTFLSALIAASAVSQEKDRRTLILLLLTRLTNCELVLGKLFASLLDILTMIAAALPVFMLATLFGGVSYEQVGRVFGVTLATALATGSLGSTLALWREKTFQTLAMTALAMVIWLVVGEVVYSGVLFAAVGGLSAESWGTSLSPLRAILAASRPSVGFSTHTVLAMLADGVYPYMAVTLAFAALLNLLAIMRVRVWNPSREVHAGQKQEEASGSIWGAEHDAASGALAGPASDAERARSGHVDARLRHSERSTSRKVWDNPVLWREICTWAYGRKILVIRLAYLALFALAAAGVTTAVAGTHGVYRGDDSTALVPAAAKPLAPYFLLSLVIVNALAVTSITNERDGQALDLLLVSDLSSKEFVFGKLWGVLCVSALMIVLPMALCVVLWWQGGTSTENLLFELGVLTVMNVFVTVLGIHCGMHYANSRTAIVVSLGTVFFLFLGVAACMMIMISFSGSFETQLAPFFIITLFGTVGLFAALGLRNPSPAILTASICLPLITFHAITSYALEHYMMVFLETVAAYGFTTAAMLIPAVAEFDIAMGRTKTAGED